MSVFTATRDKMRRLIFLERSPESGEVFLNQRRVFTLPNKAGWMFVLVLIILFIGATNYNLSLGFALTFVLTSCGLINAVFAFRNLAYLHLRAGTVAPVFAGEEAQFSLYLINRRNNPRFAIWVGFAAKGHPEQAIDVAANSRSQLQLSYPTERRGLLQIPRVRLQTWFPLGLLRAWSTWLPDVQAIVYPQPEAYPPPLPFIGAAEQEGDGNIGDEDFSGVRAYQAGDPMKHLAWKHIARVDIESGGHLITKQFSGGAAGSVLIDFAALPRLLDTELKLSRMSAWVLLADGSGVPYAFQLGALHYVAATGVAHRQQCLEALALYPDDGRAIS